MTRARRRGSSGILVLLLALWGAGCSDRQSSPVAARLPAHQGPGWPASLAIPVPDESAYTRVVLVTIDTLRADHLGSYGYFRDVTPFLDELASKGVRFAQALSPVAHTAPSHASMFTGLSPKRHGLRRNGEALTDATPTLASAFRAAGWDTAAFTSVSFLRGAANGFQTISAMRRAADEVTRDAMGWLSGRDPSRPFFLWVHYYDVHEWYLRLAPDEERAAVQAATKVVGQPLFDELASRHGWPRGSALRASNPLDWGQIPTRGGGGKPFRIESHEQAIAWVDTYDAAVARVDAEIRRLFEFAESLEPTLPALWIVTSDHGEGLGGHGYYGHGRHVYAEQLQVPLIVFASDSSLPARTIEALVSLVDLAPSVADLLGNPGPSADPAIEGASFASLVRADDGRWIDRPAFAERRPLDDLRRALGRTHEEIDAIQSGSYKYIRVEGGRDEFYDLATDALELHNIVDQPHPARDELRSLLEVKLTWLNEHAGRAEPIADQHVEELRALGYIQ